MTFTPYDRRCGLPYDPRNQGAECDRCPLGPNGPEMVHQRGSSPWTPVPGHHPDDAFALTVAEAPAGTEVETGEPLTGPSGQLHDEGIRRIGWNPQRHFAKTNVIECRCPENNYAAMQARLKKANDRLPPDRQWPQPADCCRPRLREEVRAFNYVLIYGDTAAKAVTGSPAGIDALAGGPMVLGTGARAMPTWHPAAILRKREDMGIWFRHLEIMRNHFRGELQWRTPWFDLHPTPERFETFLASGSPWWAWDMETPSTVTHRAAPWSSVWCISVATAKLATPCWLCGGRKPSCFVCRGEDPALLGGVHRAVGLHLRSVEDGTEREGLHLLPTLAREFQNPARWWVGHNSTYFDATIAEREDVLGVAPLPARHRDTAMFAALAWPNRSKALGRIAPMFIDIHSWKADHLGNKIAVNPADDNQMLTYCCIDSSVTAGILPGLAQIADEMGANRPIREDLRPRHWPGDRPWTLLEVDHFSHGVICGGMHKAGIAVDPKAQQRHATRLTAEMAKHGEVLGNIAAHYGVRGPTKRKRDGPEPHNPNSNQQVAHLLYDVWGWEPVEYTESLERSVKDDVLLEHVRDGIADDMQLEYLLTLRKYRTAAKARGTFVDPLVEEDWQRVEDKETKRLVWKNRGGLVEVDGRVHSSFGRWAAPGRFTSNDKNMQNDPFWARDQYVAEDGYSFVGADVTACHLYIIANHWKIPSLRKGITEKLDLHVNKAASVLGDERMARMAGWPASGYSRTAKPAEGSEADVIRHAFKVLNYTGAYDASVGTLWNAMVTVQAKDGSFPLEHWDLDRVRAIRQQEMKAEPEWEQLWHGRTELFLQRRYVEEPLMGRRSQLVNLDGLTAEEIHRFCRSDIVNWEILGAEAAFMRIVEIECAGEFPHDYAGKGTGTGVVLDMHDHVFLKVRDCDVPWARDFLHETMNRKIDGWDIPFEADVHVGKSIQAA